MRLVRLALLLSLVAPLKALAEQNAEDYFERGNSHFSQGEFDKAIVYYRKAIELQPDFA